MQKQEYNLVILIKHGLYPEFIELAREAQAKTWLVNEKPMNIKIIHYYGIPGGKIIQLLDKYHEKIRFHSRVSHYLLRFFMQIVSFPFLEYVPTAKISNKLGTVDTEVQCQVIDTLFTLRWKQLAIYKYILDNYEFEYIYDTNGSTYLDLTNLLLQVNSFTESPLYAGNIPSEGFISGANRFFDKKAVDLVMMSKRNWNAAILEDVAVGKLMKFLGIPMLELGSVSVATPEEITRLSDETLLNNYHFRAKSYVGAVRNDAIIMKLLHERYQKLRRHERP